MSAADLNKFEILSTDQILKLPSPGSTNQEREVFDQDFEENYDSDESLGILQLEDLPPFESLIFDKDKSNRDLNFTGNLLNRATELFSECQNIRPEPSIGELLTSPICIMPNVSSCATSVESHVYSNKNMPKYASTPKHETNYSYVIGDNVISTQNVLQDLQLNKKVSEKNSEKEMHLEFTLNNTNVTETLPDSVTPLMTNIYISASVSSETDENMSPEQNILNVTCNITNPLDIGQSSLNKTFESLDVLTDKKCVLPTVESHVERDLTNELDIQDHSIQVLKPEYSHFIPHLIPEQCDAATLDDSDLCEENVLNATCNLGKTLTINPISVTKSLENINFSKSIAANILNTTLSYPQELGKTQQIYFASEKQSNILNTEENVIVLDKTEILNTTYEKNESQKVDTSIKTLQCITNFEDNIKPVLLGIKGKKKTEVLSFTVTDVKLTKDEVRNKGNTFDRKKNLRRSVGCFDRTNVINAELKNRPTRRNSLASNIYTSSAVCETKIISHSNAEGLPPKYSTKDIGSKSSLNVKENLVDLNPDSNINEKTFRCSPLKPKLSNCKGEEIKSVTNNKLKSSRESVLNKTINLPSPISDMGKTVIKKPRGSMHFSYPKKSSFEPCNTPLCKNSKIMIRPYEKRTLLRISPTGKIEIDQKSSKEEASSLSSKTYLKKSAVVNTVILEETKKVSGLPQKGISQQKICSRIPSSEIKFGNIVKLPSNIPGLKPVNNRGISQALKKPPSPGSQFACTAKLNDTILISDHQSRKEQSTKAVKPISITKGTSRIPLSKIPCMSRSSRRQDTGEKSS